MSIGTKSYLHELDRQRQLLDRGGEVLELVEALEERSASGGAAFLRVRALVRVPCHTGKREDKEGMREPAQYRYQDRSTDCR